MLNTLNSTDDKKKEKLPNHRPRSKCTSVIGVVVDGVDDKLPDKSDSTLFVLIQKRSCLGMDLTHVINATPYATQLALY